MNVEIEWKSAPNKYGPDTARLVVADFEFARVDWNPVRSKSDGPENQYLCKVLFGGKTWTRVFETKGEGKAFAEKIVSHCFAKIGGTP